MSQVSVCILQRSIWGQLCHNAARRLSQFERLLQMRPSFGGCTSTVLRGLTYSKILCAIVCRGPSLFAGLGGRNGDVRVKYLVTQPGNASKARPSHLTTADESLEESKGQVLRRMQTLNWDTATYRCAGMLSHDQYEQVGCHRRDLLCLNSGSASFEAPGICGLQKRVLLRDLVTH